MPCGDAGFEHGPRRLAGADPLGDFVQAARGAEGVFHVGGRALGRGDDVAFREHTAAVELQGRCADADRQKTFSGLDAETSAGFVDLLYRR